jgi:hypothetical protein
MMEDEIVKEVREVRRRIFAECGNDLKRLFERLKAAEVNDEDRLVSLEKVQERARNGTQDMMHHRCATAT